MRNFLYGITLFVLASCSDKPIYNDDGDRYIYCQLVLQSTFSEGSISHWCGHYDKNCKHIVDNLPVVVWTNDYRENYSACPYCVPSEDWNSEGCIKYNNNKVNDN